MVLNTYREMSFRDVFQLLKFLNPSRERGCELQQYSSCGLLRQARQNRGKPFSRERLSLFSHPRRSEQEHSVQFHEPPIGFFLQALS